MPLLTDRQEPEDFDRNHPDDPNEYALRYLFNPNNSTRDLARAARILLYSAAACNLLAVLLYLAWVELDFSPLLLALAGLVVALSGWAALLLRQDQPGRAMRLAWLPLPLTGLSVLLLFALSESNAALFSFLLPGSAAMLIARVLFSLSENRPLQQ